MSLLEKSKNNFELMEYCRDVRQDYNNAVSRLYYSTFNFIQYILNKHKKGFGNTEGANSHIELLDRLLGTMGELRTHPLTTNKTKSLFLSFKKLREQADYDTEDTEPDTFKTAFYYYESINRNLMEIKEQYNVR